MATWFRKPSTGMLQLLCFATSNTWTNKWLVPPKPLRGYDPSMYSLFAHILCWESDRPDGQTFHPRAESRTGLV